MSNISFPTPPVSCLSSPNGTIKRRNVLDLLHQRPSKQQRIRAFIPQEGCSNMVRPDQIKYLCRSSSKDDSPLYQEGRDEEPPNDAASKMSHHPSLVSTASLANNPQLKTSEQQSSQCPPPRVDHNVKILGTSVTEADPSSRDSMLQQQQSQSHAVTTSENTQHANLGLSNFNVASNKHWYKKPGADASNEIRALKERIYRAEEMVSVLMESRLRQKMVIESLSRQLKDARRLYNSRWR